ncbi:TPA: hypothetical protein DHW58_00470 [Patescibacteria group bacterium]|nr:hypothetical protein [Patescibacteria group bacterium]
MYSTGYWDGLDGTSYEKKLDEYTLSKFKPGDTSWSYVVSAQYNNLVGDNARLVAKAYFTGGSIKQAEVRVTYSYTVAEMGKPVIYLYPTSTQQVVVNVKPTSGISYSEPVISANGWRVTAQPDGTLTDASGQTWPYLFWEGFATDFATPKEGFVVEQSEVSQFFSNKLSQLGLNTTEIADFKEFWLPRLSDKPYYFITFIPQAAFDSYAPLTVIPTPQTVIRVFFDYCGLDQPMVVAPQILPPTPARVGFTAVEWGGRLYR